MPGYSDIFFDLDGTLVDSLPGIEFSARAALANVQPGRMLPGLRPFIGPPIREIFRQVLGEEEGARLDALNAAFRRSYDGGGWMHTVTYPEVPEALAILRRRGYRCHVVTNKPLLPTQRILDHLQLTPWLDAVVAPESRTPAFRSKEEMALDLRRRLGLGPGGGAMVGDSRDDAAAAEACGFQFFAAAYGFGEVARYLPDGRHFILAEFRQLIQFLPARA